MRPHGLVVYLGLICFSQKVLGHMGPSTGLSIKGRTVSFRKDCGCGKHIKGSPCQHYSCCGENLNSSLYFKKRKAVSMAGEL